MGLPSSRRAPPTPPGARVSPPGCGLCPGQSHRGPGVRQGSSLSQMRFSILATKAFRSGLHSPEEKTVCVYSLVQNCETISVSAPARSESSRDVHRRPALTEARQREDERLAGRAAGVGAEGRRGGGEGHRNWRRGGGTSPWATSAVSPTLGAGFSNHQTQ